MDKLGNSHSILDLNLHCCTVLYMGFTQTLKIILFMVIVKGRISHYNIFTQLTVCLPICANKIMFNSSLCIYLICSWVMWYVQCRINMQLSLIGRLNLSRGLGWNVDLDWERKIGKCFVIILLVCHRLSLFFLPLGIVCQWKQFLEALLTHRHFLQTTPDITHEQKLVEFQWINFKA